MITAIWSIIIFCTLIFVHEFGHFITAKLSGMTVHEFSIGMGPKLFSYNGKNTAYSLRLLPLGGFVRLEGEDGDSADENAFCNKSFFSRFSVLFAGAFMNILLGFLLFIIVFSSIPTIQSNTIGEVVVDSPLYKAGIKDGDTIIKMEGETFSTSVHTFRDINLFMSLNGGNDALITFRRGDTKFEKSITPIKNDSDDRYIIGMVAGNVEKNIFNIISIAFWECVFVIKSVYLSLWWLITGVVPASSMAGPVAIIGEIGNAAKVGWQSLCDFAAFISVNLGVMNLLPIPALDGGRILFLIIEKIRRKRMKPETEGLINFLFFAMLIVFMIAVTFSDLKKLFL